MASSSSPVPLLHTWTELQQRIGNTAVGAALNHEVQTQQSHGQGAPHVHNTKRIFPSPTTTTITDPSRSTATTAGSEDEPRITIFRDHAGWYVSLYLVQAESNPT
jgi:hypothetical protein